MEAQNQFENDDTDSEKRLEEAIAAVAQCASERSLDNRVAEASKCLDRIEEGYRSYHTANIQLLSQYPKDVAGLNTEYEQRVLELLSMKKSETIKHPESGDDPTKMITYPFSP